MGRISWTNQQISGGSLEVFLGAPGPLVPSPAGTLCRAEDARLCAISSAVLATEEVTPQMRIDGWS